VADVNNHGEDHPDHEGEDKETHKKRSLLWGARKDDECRQGS
jgi:hypothetical protein